MAADIQLRINLESFRAAVRQFPGWLYREEAPACERASIGTRDAMVLERLSGPRPERVAPRSGAMRRSVKQVVFGSNIQSLGYHVYLDVGEAPYAPFHEAPPAYTDVVPTRAKMLAIPLRAAKTGDRDFGIVRREYAAPKGGSLRQVPGLFLVKRGGRAFLCKRDAKGGLIFLYVLKDRIKYKRKLGFAELFRRDLRPGGRAYQHLARGLFAAAAQWQQAGQRDLGAAAPQAGG